MSGIGGFKNEFLCKISKIREIRVIRGFIKSYGFLRNKITEPFLRQPFFENRQKL